MSKVNEILDHLISDVAPDEDGCSQYEGLDEQDEAESTAKLSAKKQIEALIVEAYKKGYVDCGIVQINGGIHNE